jgi:hypothetical protein
MGLERGPLSLVSTTEELLDRKVAAPVYPQKLAITSPSSGGRSVGIVRSRTQTMEFSFFLAENNWKVYLHNDWWLVTGDSSV